MKHSTKAELLHWQISGSLIASQKYKPVLIKKEKRQLILPLSIFVRIFYSLRFKFCCLNRKQRAEVKHYAAEFHSLLNCGSIFGWNQQIVFYLEHYCTLCSSLLLTVLTIHQGYEGYYWLFRVIWHTKSIKKGDLPRPPMTVIGLEGFLYVVKAVFGSS